MRKFFRAAEIALLVTGGLLYISAKIHFFSHYRSSNYLSEHWPFWAGMVAAGVAIAVLDWVRKCFVSAGER